MSQDFVKNTLRSAAAILISLFIVGFVRRSFCAENFQAN